MEPSKIDHWSPSLAALAGGISAGALMLGASAVGAPARWLVGAGVVGSMGWWASRTPWIALQSTPEAAPEPEISPVVREPVAPQTPVLDMVALPAGRFQMGEEHDPHPVQVSAFSMSRTPVTRAQWAEVMATEADDDPRPKAEISWFNAVAFCNALSVRDGRTPCYNIDGQRVRWRRESDGYRLSTEAEWEYACRAGTTTRYSFGDDEDQLDEHAWFEENSDNEAQPVAQKPANPWGLYDLHGNVWEWCWDSSAPYDAQPSTDPVGAMDVLLVADSGERAAQVEAYLTERGLRVQRVLPDSAGGLKLQARCRTTVVLTGDGAMWHAGAERQGDHEVIMLTEAEMEAVVRQLDDKIVKGPIRWGRVLRGGSFVNTAWRLRSAFRFRYPPAFRDSFIGFRCVLGPRPQQP